MPLLLSTHTNITNPLTFLFPLSSPTTTATHVPPSLCPSLWLSLPLSKAVVTVRLLHIIPARWKLNEGGLTQLTEACFEGCNQGKLRCQILFHGLWICVAEARTRESLSHAEAQTTGLISPPDLWKLHFFPLKLFILYCQRVWGIMGPEWSRWWICSLDCSLQHTWMCSALWRCQSCQGESNECCYEFASLWICLFVL